MQPALSQARIPSQADPLQSAYQRGADIYDGMSVQIDGESFKFIASQSPASCRTLRETYLDPAIPSEYKDRLSLAILTVELSNILHGNFDSSRNPDSIRVSGNSIIHENFRPMDPGPYEKDGYKQLAGILLGAVKDGNGSSPDLEKARELIEAELEDLRAAGKEINPLVLELHSAFEGLKDIIAQLDHKKDGPRVLVSAISGGVCREARDAILAETPLMIKHMVKRWLDTGKAPNVLMALSPVKVGKDEMIEITRAA